MRAVSSGPTTTTALNVTAVAMTEYQPSPASDTPDNVVALFPGSFTRSYHRSYAPNERSSLRVPRVHTPKEPVLKTFSCPLCEKRVIEGTVCSCSYRLTESPGLRTLRTRYVEGRKTAAANEAAREAMNDSMKPPPAPMCGWCNRRPPVDTGGLCRSCGGEP